MKKRSWIYLIIAIIFCAHWLSIDSRSITVLDVERVGDRLLSSEELELILQQSTKHSLAVDIEYQNQLYAVETTAEGSIIRNEQGEVYFQSARPIRLLATLSEHWLIARENPDYEELLLVNPATGHVREITKLYHETIADVVVWQSKVYFDTLRDHQNSRIFCYDSDNGQLKVFAQSGFAPKLHQGRLHYLYRSGEAIGFESASPDGTDLISFAPTQNDVYSYFFRGAQIDFLTIASIENESHFLRIQDAFGASQVEKFEYFKARFQSEQLVFGSNGNRDSILRDNTLIQMPSILHYRSLIGDRVYYTYADQQYSIGLSQLEAILQSTTLTAQH